MASVQPLHVLHVLPVPLACAHTHRSVSLAWPCRVLSLALVCGLGMFLACGVGLGSLACAGGWAQL